jgi:hypothetical protein
MKINNSSDFIRQAQVGQFRRLEDGKEPFVRVKGQKLESTKDQKTRSIYIDQEKLLTFEKGIGSNSLNLFDFDAGLKYKTERISGTTKGEKLPEQYDKNGKERNTTKQETLVDKLA